MLSQDIPHIFALTLFEDYVYWTDWETKSINRAHKTTGTNKTLLISTLHRPMDLHVFHALRQPDGERPRGSSGRASEHGELWGGMGPPQSQQGFLPTPSPALTRQCLPDLGHSGGCRQARVWLSGAAAQPGPSPGVL